MEAYGGEAALWVSPFLGSYSGPGNQKGFWMPTPRNGAIRYTVCVEPVEDGEQVDLFSVYLEREEADVACERLQRQLSGKGFVARVREVWPERTAIGALRRMDLV